MVRADRTTRGDRQLPHRAVLQIGAIVRSWIGALRGIGIAGQLLRELSPLLEFGKRLCCDRRARLLGRMGVIGMSCKGRLQSRDLARPSMTAASAISHSCARMEASNP